MKTIKFILLAMTLVLTTSAFASQRKELHFSAEQIKETPYFYCDNDNDSDNTLSSTLITFHIMYDIGGQMIGKEIKDVPIQDIKRYYFSLTNALEIEKSAIVYYFTNNESGITCNIGKSDRSTSYNIP